MGMSLPQLRSSLRKALGTDENDTPNADADLLLNRSLWEISETFPFREKDYSVNFDTIAGTPKYTMPANFEALIDIAILDPTSEQWTPLIRSTKVNYDASLNANATKYAKPCEYVRDNDCIILWPTPDIEYSIKMRYQKTIADLTDANTTLGLPQSWHDIVLLGAIWRGFIDLGDYDRSNAAKAHQLSLISSAVPVEAKEEFDTHLGGVEVYGRTGRL